MIDRRILGQLDTRLIIMTVALMVIGIFNLYSANVNIPGEAGSFYQRQLFWFGIGFTRGGGAGGVLNRLSLL